MKKSIMLILIFISFLSYGRLIAECTDCAGVQWIAAEYDLAGFTGCPACSIHVSMEYKDSDNPYCKEIRVLFWYVMNLECQECISQNGWDYDKILSDIYDKLMTEGPLTPPSGGSSMIKFAEDPCWHFVTGSVTLPDGYYPCGTNVCCRKSYYVYNTGDDIFLEFLGGSAIPANYDCTIIGCTDECWKDHTPRISVNANPGNTENAGTNTIITPNPTVESINVSLLSEVTGTAQFKLYDELGNEILSKEINKPAKNLIFSLDLKTVLPGVYVYRIFINNTTVSSGKILVSY